MWWGCCTDCEEGLRVSLVVVCKKQKNLLSWVEDLHTHLNIDLARHFCLHSQKGGGASLYSIEDSSHQLLESLNVEGQVNNTKQDTTR